MTYSVPKNDFETAETKKRRLAAEAKGLTYRSGQKTAGGVGFKSGPNNPNIDDRGKQKAKKGWKRIVRVAKSASATEKVIKEVQGI